ncbi:MAG: potassium-transporting ATPase subunit F [Bacteroidales bacterium]|nr:potassium-transporting ATPase subunit F [Bacteroidales bacterium]
MNATNLLTVSSLIEIETSLGYLLGVLIALFVFAYLIYTLVKPEKF